MTFPKIRLDAMTPLGAYQGWESVRLGVKLYTPEWDHVLDVSENEFRKGGYDLIITKIQSIIKKLFLKDLNTAEGVLPFFLAIYYWMCQKIDLIDVHQPESSRLLILRDQLLDSFVNMRYPEMRLDSKESFMQILREVHATLVSLEGANTQKESWEELGSLLFDHRFILEAALSNITLKARPSFLSIQTDLMQQMLMAKKILTQISLDLEDLLRRMHEFKLFEHALVKEWFVDFREDAKRAVDETKQEIASFDWEQLDLQSAYPLYSINEELILQRFYFFRKYSKNISTFQEQLEKPEEECLIQFDPNTIETLKQGLVEIANKKELQAVLDHFIGKRRLHFDYDAKISAPRIHLVKILSAICDAKKSNPKKWAVEWPKALQEWKRRVDAPPALSVQEVDRMWESEKPLTKKRAVKAKGSKPKAFSKVAERIVVVKEHSKPALPERSLASIIQDVVPSGLSTDYTVNALKQARIYEIDLLVLKQMLENRLQKEQLGPVSILSIRVSALYLEQLFRSEILDWKNDPEASLKIHNLRLFESRIAKNAEGLVNRLFLAHYWVDYPEEQWKKWTNANKSPPELLAQMQNESSLNQESIQALIEEALQVGRIWIQEKTNGHPVQRLPEENHSDFKIPLISLTAIKKKIRQWPKGERGIMERQLRMIDFCFKTPASPSFQIRHGLHWMQLSFEYALRLAVHRKTGVMLRSHDLLALADTAQIDLSDEEKQYLSAYFQTGRQLSSYLYDWADPEKLLDQLLIKLDQGQEAPPLEVLDHLMRGFAPLLSNLVMK